MPATARAARRRSSLYRRLGFDVVPLYCELDGRFPNHHPDPTQPENVADLIATVQANERRARHRARRRRRSDRRGRRHRPDPVGRSADDPARQGAARRGPGREVRRRGEVLAGDVRRARGGGRPGRDVEGRPLADQGAHEGDRRAARRRDVRATCSSRTAGSASTTAIYAGARLLELLSRGERTLAELARPSCR